MPVQWFNGTKVTLKFRTTVERPVDGSKGQLCLLHPAFALVLESVIFVFPQLKRNVSRGEPALDC